MIVLYLLPAITHNYDWMVRVECNMIQPGLFSGNNLQTKFYDFSKKKNNCPYILKPSIRFLSIHEKR